MSKTYTKYWPKDLFCTNLETFKSRTMVLEKIGGKYPSIMKHNFSVNGNLIKLETEFVEDKKNPNGMQAIDPLKGLADDLMKINQYIPHGDILKRNAIWNGTNFVLIDWEPLLEYGIPPNILFKSTKPYIASTDLANSKISISTDKIAFFYFCRKIIHGWFPTDKKEIVKLEKMINSKDFFEIVEFAIRSHSIEK